MGLNSLPEDFADLLAEFEKTDVRYLIVGGYALAAVAGWRLVEAVAERRELLEDRSRTGTPRHLRVQPVTFLVPPTTCASTASFFALSASP